MNFTQSFEEFSKGLGPTDLVLYAGIGLVVWILFKDKLSPIQGLLQLGLESVKRLFNNNTKPSTPVPAATNTAKEVLENVLVNNSKPEPEDLFFKLIVSWKETRDLALQCKCDKAVEVADSMFPYLSPNVCGKDSEK